MRRKRPCRICRRWYVPHPRAGDRQHVCSAADCQRERHRRACQRWREHEVPAERAHRLRQRLRVDVDGAALSRVSWDGNWGRGFDSIDSFHRQRRPSVTDGTLRRSGRPRLSNCSAIRPHCARAPRPARTPRSTVGGEIRRALATAASDRPAWRTAT
jgi:hypothetical protein